MSNQTTNSLSKYIESLLGTPVPWPLLVDCWGVWVTLRTGDKESVCLGVKLIVDLASNMHYWRPLTEIKDQWKILNCDFKRETPAFPEAISANTSTRKGRVLHLTEILFLCDRHPLEDLYNLESLLLATFYISADTCAWFVPALNSKPSFLLLTTAQVNCIKNVQKCSESLRHLCFLQRAEEQN